MKRVFGWFRKLGTGIALLLTVHRLSGDVGKLEKQAQKGNLTMLKTIIFDVLQVAGIVAGIYSQNAQGWVAKHPLVDGIAVAVLAALNRLMPSWFQKAQQ